MKKSKTKEIVLTTNNTANLVSVLMTVYNTPFNKVKQAIDSVLKQDFLNYELIVIDDGSHLDLSLQILSYCQLHQHKIKYMRHSNCGQSQSINVAVKICNGDYITILDSDDEYKPNHLSACLKGIEDNDLISSHTETIINTPEDYFVPDKNNHQKNIHVDDCILFATLFGKREVFLNQSFKNKYAADAIFYEQAALNYKVKKINLRTYIYYRNVSNSISAKLKKESLIK